LNSSRAEQIPISFCSFFNFISSLNLWIKGYLLVAKHAMEFDDEFVFFFGEIPAFEIRTKIVYPPEPATFAAPKQACKENNQS